MFKPTMGIQLFTLMRHIQTAEDFDSTLGKLKKMGVRDVQISGIGDIPAETQRDILQKHDMKVCVTHKDIELMEDDLPALVNEHRIIDCNAIGLGCAPDDCRATHDAVVPFIKRLESIAENIGAQGMSFHYHNHNFEFDKLEGSDSTMMDLLLNSRGVNFIPDVAWASFAGVDPAELLYKMKGRVKVIHFKDYVLNNDGSLSFVSLGRGTVDLKACYDAAVRLEIPYIVYEQDNGWVDDDAFIATAQSWEFLQSLNK